MVTGRKRSPRRYTRRPASGEPAAAENSSVAAAPETAEETGTPVENSVENTVLAESSTPLDSALAAGSALDAGSSLASETTPAVEPALADDSSTPDEPSDSQALAPDSESHHTLETVDAAPAEADGHVLAEESGAAAEAALTDAAAETTAASEAVLFEAEPGESRASSLLSRWKEPEWVAAARGSTRDPEAVPALLRLPETPDGVQDEQPAPSFSAQIIAGAATGDLQAAAQDLADEFAPAPHTTGRSSEGVLQGAFSAEENAAGSEAAVSEAPLFGFQFRSKSVSAPTPEEAAEQMEWLTAPGRAGRIGRREDLPRGPQGRTPLRAPRSGAPLLPGEDMLHTGGDLAPDLQRLGDIVEPFSRPADLEEAGAEPAADAEGREDRAGKGRRRKDRRGRGRDRNGADRSAEDLAADTEIAAAAEPGEPGALEVRRERVTPTPAVKLEEDLQSEREALERIGLDQRLGKEIFVNTGARETRIAYLVAGQLTELHIEREERLVGAICKARVDRVLPGMDAAFVDAGLERNAFLMAGDVTPDDEDDEKSNGRRPSRHHIPISELLKPRQEIMVQITKAPHSTKGARVSTRISLPGRYLVLMPDTESTGVSRKIDDEDERDRLKKIARAIRPSGFGIIVRTEAENKTEEELRGDVAFLVRLWGQIQEKYRASRPGSIVHRDLSLTFKVIRDLFGSDVNRFVIDSRDEYEKAMELVDFISPRMKARVILHEEPTPLFERIGIEEEIDRLFRNKVWLKSGGTLLIDETEALTTIDVNSGKYVGTSNPQQTIFKINMEAINEICRQLRLRDIGGMIILDFIDMSNPRDRQAVMKALEVSLKKDRARTKIAHLSPLGLVEMTRKRTGETFREMATEPCYYCGGRGRTMNADTVSIFVERELNKQRQEVDDEAFLVMVHPNVAPFLLGPEGENTDRLERDLRRAIYVRSTENLHIEKFEVSPGDMQEMERQLLPYREGQVLDCIVEQTPAINLPHAIARVDGYLLDLVNGGQYLGRKVRAKLTRVGRSIASAEVVSAGRLVDKLG